MGIPAPSAAAAVSADLLCVVVLMPLRYADGGAIPVVADMTNLRTGSGVCAIRAACRRTSRRRGLRGAWCG